MIERFFGIIRTIVVEQETALDGRGALRARQRPIHMQTRLQQHSLPRYIECMYFPYGTRKSKEEAFLAGFGTGSIPLC